MNNQVIYLYMNLRIKYKIHIFYLKPCLGLAIVGNCALPSTDLIFIILYWRQSHLSFFSSQSPFISLSYVSVFFLYPAVLLNADEQKMVQNHRQSLSDEKFRYGRSNFFFHFGVPTEATYLALSKYIGIDYIFHWLSSFKLERLPDNDMMYLSWF